MHQRVLRPPAVRRGAALTLGVCALAGCGATGSRSSSPPPSALPAESQVGVVAAPTAPLLLVGTSPLPSATLVAGTPLVLTFSAPVDAASSTPTITPDTAGTWTRAGATLTFTPTGTWHPYTPVTVAVPGDLRSAGVAGARLGAGVTLRYAAPTPSMHRFQELLGELHYLPVSWTPAGASAPATSEAGPAGSVSAADMPGAFEWRFANVPPTLAAGWQPGVANVVTRGATIAFEADHGLTIDGLGGPSVWSALTSAAVVGQASPRPYDYITVALARPQVLRVWQDGATVYTSPANTGVAQAPTAPGTFPVYERFTSTTMSGHNPDGSVYHDPGIPWVAYFNGGDAIHGFVRPGYGYPQSVGCVELPPDNAKAVYPMDYYGTLVTVG